MFVLRGSIGRNKFGLLHEGLFTKALAGSKVLVETYHNVVCAALDFVCDAPVVSGEEPIPTEARLAFFNETRHAYGRTALLLSGGASLGFYHVGVVKTLLENNLMPRVIGGSSAGSILCAMVGTRTDEECEHDLFDARGTNAPGHSGDLRLNFFRPLKQGADLKVGGEIAKVYHNTAGGAFHDIRRTLQGLVPIPLRHATSFFYDVLTGNRRASDVFKNDTEHFRECVRTNVGNFTFQEAFDRTGRILNIVVTPQNSSDPPRLLNYLTSPHVMVWSAVRNKHDFAATGIRSSHSHWSAFVLCLKQAVASSSLPGVFEANRLVVKEADGWERYESSQAQAFSDGSLETDLPTQQLAEMFNVNHFIISQANPHAVLFASYNQKKGLWTNPVTGVVHAVLSFLKNQVRAWLFHLVEAVGAQRIAPFFDTQRGVGTQFFTQEYEGRPSDISFVPWYGHRSLLSALLHIIYNPSEAEFREWILAAQRETWRYIPAIKSHIAEEITLDRGVQRLRKRLLHESWEKARHASVNATHKAANPNFGDRVPSFVHSPSLVNLGGLGVSDQPTIEGLHTYNSTSPVVSYEQPQRHPVSIPEVDINSGWGGMGLRGNRSSGNLQRTASDGSGLFIDEEEQAAQQDAGERSATEQAPRRKTSIGSLPRANGSESSFGSHGYLKTTSMARFYYRNCNTQSLDALSERFPKTTSDLAMDQANSSEPVRIPAKTHHRQKSKSHTELTSRSWLGESIQE